MRRAGWCVLLVAVVLSACGTGGLELRADRRLQFLSPRDLSTVTLPFTLVWKIDDFAIEGANGDTSGRGGYFAVLVDVGPPPPGADLTYFARKDETCLRTPGCPNEAYLNDRNVFPTTKTGFLVEGLADTRPRGRPSTKDRHELTVVLLDGKGQRIGESAWTLRVFIHRAAEQS